MWKRLFCTCCRVVVSLSVLACLSPFVHFDILEIFVMAAVPLLLFNDFLFSNVSEMVSAPYSYSLKSKHFGLCPFIVYF